MDRPSLEALVEAEDLGLEILHPGGLVITRELASLTGIVTGTSVLEIAAGTGETAHVLAAECGARVTATDISPRMVRRLQDKFSARGSAVQIVWADAHQLPFRNDSFDVALSGCSVCHFDKLRALGEMVRVVQPGGRVGIHDLCWKTAHQRGSGSASPRSRMNGLKSSAAGWLCLRARAWAMFGRSIGRT